MAESKKARRRHADGTLAKGEPNYTKAGPGRKPKRGPGKDKHRPRPDSTDPIWLNASHGPEPVRERENANARRPKVVTHGV